MTVREIEVLVKKFGTAARLVKSAGIDAVELHAHEGYMIDQFMTSLWNKRTDKYGGDLGGRLRFLIEIIESIKDEAGPDFPIICKYPARHYFEGGREVPESCEIAKHLERAGIAALEIDAGCYESAYLAHPPTYMPSGCIADDAAAIKKCVSIPVIAVGKLGQPDLAEKVLSDGKADFIGLARPLLADPDWAEKVKQGRVDDIRPCTGCHDCWRRTFLEAKYLSCAINPLTGIERELSLTLATRKKTVLVVGGGPAGMEAARVAILRGHDTTLWERTDKLGGNMIPASIPSFKRDYAAFTDYLSTQVRKAGVNIQFLKEATPELIQQAKPDEVIIATGAMPLIPDIPGLAKAKVATVVDVLLGKDDLGENIVIVGGGDVGCETAVWLAQKGKRVTVVEILSDILSDMFFPNRMMLVKMLTEADVRVLTSTQISEITKEGVIIQKNGDKQDLKADTIVLAVGRKPRRELLESLEGKLPALHAIGDCVEPRKLMNAIWEAYNIARLI